MWSRDQVEVRYQRFFIEQSKDVVQLLAFRYTEHYCYFFSGGVFGFHLLNDGLKTIDIMANIENDSFLPIAYSFEAARLAGLTYHLAELVIVSDLLMSAYGPYYLVGNGIVLLNERVQGGNFEQSHILFFRSLFYRN